MALATTTRVICDGCGQDVDWDNTRYRVWFADDEQNHLHFHNYDCVVNWAQGKQAEWQAKNALADKHAELHAALDSLPAVPVDDFRQTISGKDAWQEANGIVESHNAAAVDQHLATLSGGQTNG